MASNPKNRNALRSKRLLTQAFSELLLELPYPKITVAAITRRADLNRGTFYAHYDNVDDLMRELIEGVMDKLFRVLDDVDETSFPRSPEPVLEKASTYLLEELGLYRLLVAGEESNVFLADMKRRIADRITPRILAGCPKACAHDARVPVVFVSSGLVDVYVSWLRGECGEVGIEEVNAEACKLTKAALKEYA
jgi:AcrR family transcriptional regulator